MSAPANEFGVRGFDAKGQLVYRVEYSVPNQKTVSAYSFLVVADASGNPVREAALTDDDASKSSVEGQAMLTKAEPRTAGEALAKEFPEVKTQGIDAVSKGPGGASIELQVDETDRHYCSLTATWTTPSRKVTGVLVRASRDPLIVKAAAVPPCADSTVAIAFRPDGSRAAVAWNIDEGSSAGHLAYVSPQDLATVQLLDAGAGKARIDALTASATSAGFHVGPSVKAKAKRAASVVYARKGFEPEAAQIAKLAGADSVLPLEWESCCAISVALAK